MLHSAIQPGEVQEVVQSSSPSLQSSGAGEWYLWDSGEWWMLLAAQSMAVGTVMVRWVSQLSDPIMATGWVRISVCTVCQCCSSFVLSKMPYSTPSGCSICIQKSCYQVCSGKNGLNLMEKVNRHIYFPHSNVDMATSGSHLHLYYNILPLHHSTEMVIDIQIRLPMACSYHASRISC